MHINCPSFYLAIVPGDVCKSYILAVKNDKSGIIVRFPSQAGSCCFASLAHPGYRNQLKKTS
jgi:hypothetical protein